jgi:hypothetical protein
VRWGRWWGWGWVRQGKAVWHVWEGPHAQMRRSSCLVLAISAASHSAASWMAAWMTPCRYGFPQLTSSFTAATLPLGREGEVRTGTRARVNRNKRAHMSLCTQLTHTSGQCS